MCHCQFGSTPKMGSLLLYYMLLLLRRALPIRQTVRIAYGGKSPSLEFIMFAVYEHLNNNKFIFLMIMNNFTYAFFILFSLLGDGYSPDFILLAVNINEHLKMCTYS